MATSITVRVRFTGMGRVRVRGRGTGTGTGIFALISYVNLPNPSPNYNPSPNLRRSRRGTWGSTWWRTRAIRCLPIRVTSEGDSVRVGTRAGATVRGLVSLNT